MPGTGLIVAESGEPDELVAVIDRVLVVPGAALIGVPVMFVMVT